MRHKKLTREFFYQNTRETAKNLLGKVLVRKIDSRKSVDGARDNHDKDLICAMITETEAYCGPNDLASHASKGKTPRTEVMFSKPGLIYVYMIYGMYYCLNIVTEKENYPAAVLIRGVQLIDPKLKFSEKSLLKNIDLGGPGKLCRYFKIDKSLNSQDLIGNRDLWIEDWGINIKQREIISGSRIGVDYAGKYKDKKWRYFIKL
ncbi:MAG: 3-methyladenine DNA glycosylase [Candidatus Yanofskybacteria bacterium CG10_big_fil_rev_8_21_14_0_10_36_16]|uniref:Putative 3-methyladenine DNA glycosylase n=1 Tax=Candidatus Yanofskybacteria bacterium CG10_big_fil_rev_8_21_14_0_10_36_16 TaxID=1975096 RepID=A0A2J0QBN6_9BACT|nr:MAG: 3-methyladenine DNA glycosylase [Candidatus Yanofskybacteria bacterium CG10_big_fil_rev_8_21_14_0_10_36_16]